MENVESIILPDFDAKPKRQKKASKTVLVEKESLPRVNRTVVCNYCDTGKVLNPEQYQILFNMHENEEKLQAEFMCKACEMAAKRNPVEFWTVHGEQLHDLSKNLKTAFDLYKNSARQPQDAVAMQTMSINFLKDCHIFEPNFEFVTENRVPVALKIKSIPYVGTVVLKVYESRKYRINLER